MKNFIQNKRGKAILFFGFYLIFFIFLAIVVSSNGEKEQKKEIPKEEVLTINKLISLNNYQYDFKIKDTKEREYHGIKENIEYQNDELNYFLNIYNINKLIKNSKLIESIDNKVTYQFNNDILNELLIINNEEGINKITVISGNNYLKINLDLYGYKENIEIILEYKGVENE